MQYSFNLFVQLFERSIVHQCMVCKRHAFGDVLFVGIFIVHLYFLLMLELFERYLILFSSSSDNPLISYIDISVHCKEIKSPSFRSHGFNFAYRHQAFDDYILSARFRLLVDLFRYVAVSIGRTEMVGHIDVTIPIERHIRFRAFLPEKVSHSEMKESIFIYEEIHDRSFAGA